MPFKFISRKGALLLCGVWLSGQAQAQRFDWQTFAGNKGGPGANDGTAQQARFFSPQAVVSDAGGILYVADANNHSIRCTAPDGTTRTLAGRAGTAGSRDGTAGEAQFRIPGGLARNSTGQLIVADTGNHTIRLIESDGRVSTLAGKPGVAGSADGRGGEARFNTPRGIVAGPDGFIYVADSQSHTIRRIAPDGSVTTLAGAAGVAGATDGPLGAARFRSPRGLAIDASGGILVADMANHTIRHISPEGLVTTLAGQLGVPGFTEGTGTAARFRNPAGVAVDAAGQIYVADGSNHAIRSISPAGVVVTLAGTGGSPGFQNGLRQQARFRSPAGIGLTPAGMVIVADTGNHALRALSPGGEVTTLAGSPRVSGTTDGIGTDARFNLPAAIARAPDGSWAVADEGNHALRRITTGAGVTMLTGTPGTPGLANGPLALASFNAPAGLCYGADGSLYVGDTGNKLIRLITPGGDVSTLAGTFAPLPGAAGALAYEQRMQDARGITLDGRRTDLRRRWKSAASD
jgi:sugar lactone lactonase YvrE